MPVYRLMPPLLMGLALSLGACASGPEQLAADLQKAVEGGDMDAAMALGKFDGAPAQLHFFYLDQVGECAQAEIVCTVSLQALDEEFKAKLVAQAELGLEAPAPPLGIVLIESKSADGKSSGKLRMPYAKVDGRYRVVAQRYSASKLGELGATSNDSLLQRALEKGTHDPSSGAARPQWLDSASKLPAGGGAPGAAFVKRAAALAAAAKAGDPDMAAQVDANQPGGWFSATDWSGKPVDLATRKHSLRAHAVRFLHDIEVTGGWQGEDSAILLANAKDGIGWVERGAFVLNKTETGWSYGGIRFTVSYPAP